MVAQEITLPRLASTEKVALQGLVAREAAQKITFPGLLEALDISLPRPASTSILSNQTDPCAKSSPYLKKTRGE
jgi:hypothetical protein